MSKTLKRLPNENHLRPVNKCIRDLRYNRTPLGMNSVAIDKDTHDALQRLAIDVFTRCSNSGHGFTDALLAVYLTGLENGSSAANEKGRLKGRSGLATVRYEVRVEDVEEGTFDDLEQATEFFEALDDGAMPIELVKITETVLKSRHVK